MNFSHSLLKAIALLVCTVTLSACQSDDNDLPDVPPVPKVPNLIVDSDLGNCTDDIFALQALFTYQAEGLCNIKGIMQDRPHQKSKDLMDRFMHFYKADDIPLGLIDGDESFFEIVPYYQLADSVKPDEQPLFPSTGISLADRMSALKLYRKLLSEAEDNSITIVSIGALTNLGLLIDSPADEYSPLTGIELIRKKVSSLEVMAGCFTPVPLRYSNSPDKSCTFIEVEYNIEGNIPLAKKVLENWPGEVHMLPIEEGMKFPSIHDKILSQYSWQKDNPVSQVYERYDEWRIGDVGQYLWDAITVMHAIFGESIFCCSESGYVRIDDKGNSTFEPDPDGNAHIVSLNTTGVSNVWNVFEHISKFHP